MSDLWREGSTLDYAKLFEIATKLVSTDIPTNKEGLKELDDYVGAPVGSALIEWYEAVKLTWQAVNVIKNNARSRDIRVNACVSLYFTRSLTDEKL